MSARTPADVDRLYGELSNAGDAEGLVALYEPGATFVTPDLGPRAGHDEIRPLLVAWVDMKPTIDMGMASVIPMGDDLAVVHHDWHATIDSPDGGRMEVSGKATEIVRRQADGSWQFILDDPYMRG